MSIKIERLRCFRTVVDHGSLAEAAQVLGRTPSAVSMMLKQFEDHIGAPLFETARKSRLTPLGQQIHAEARRELDHFDRTIATLAQAGLRADGEALPVTRRQALARVAAAAAVGLMLPAITSINAPLAAQAQSGGAPVKKKGAGKKKG